MKSAAFIALAVALGGCAYQNPNIYTYGWAPPAPPDPNGRSFLGYDPQYEQSLIDHYVKTHWAQVKEFRTRSGIE